ncbi:MAG: HEAT repeat domain-containing protein [Deltaproteobacteria bacterium]|nr:HEAT repeat domain-containing protein [Deltaproteobacteria bacterium]
MMRSCPAPRASWVAACVGLVLALGSGAADAADLFADVDASVLVARGKVEAVASYDAAKLWVFRLRVERALKGEAAPGDAIALAQEILFPTTRPYFAVGMETLVLAVPLPDYSSFRNALPEGTYWRWTRRLDTAAEVAWLGDPAVAERVARYVAVRDDGEASADFFVSTLVGPHRELSGQALAAMTSRRTLVPLLDTGRLAPLASWLRDGRAPLAERAAVMVRLARAGAPGMADVAEGLLGDAGGLQPVALDVLVTLDRVPPSDRLLGWSRSGDDALRLAACRGLVKVGTPEALGRVAEVLAGDGSANVRLELAKALGRVQDARIVRVLADAMATAEKPMVLAAADALAAIAAPEAIEALHAVLEHGRPDAQAAAAFALKRSGTPEGQEILESLERSHADPQVRRLCKLALGESLHEH